MEKIVEKMHKEIKKEYEADEMLGTVVRSISHATRSRHDKSNDKFRR